MHLQRLENAQVTDKRVLVRIDAKGLIDHNGNISNPIVFDKILPTLEILIQRKASILLLTHVSHSHFDSEQAVSLESLANYITHKLKKPVHYLRGPLPFGAKNGKRVGKGNGKHASTDQAAGHIEQTLGKDLILLENLAAYKEERQNSPDFARGLASLGDIYVNESRGANREQYASIVSLPKLIPAYAGVALFDELEFLQSLREKNQNGVYLVLGGTGIEKKVTLLRSCMTHLRGLILGGGIAYSFLHSRAVPVGKSLREEQMEVLAFQLIEKAELQRVETFMPRDHIIAKQIRSDASTKSSAKISDDWIGVDVGSKSLGIYQKALSKASIVLWYGPLGVNEIKKFSKSSDGLARFLAKSKARVCALGDDTTKLIASTGKSSRYDYLEPDSDFVMDILSGNPLPGLLALENTEKI